MSASSRNNPKSLAFAGILTAFSVVCLILARFVPAALAMPAAAGIFLMPAVMELGIKWALFSFAASALPGFLFGDGYALIFYLLFFGWYPILKAVFEKIPARPLEYAAKLLLFSGAAVLAWQAALRFLGAAPDMPEFLGALGRFLPAALLIAGNILFLIYDFALSRIAGVYRARIHPKLHKLLK